MATLDERLVSLVAPHSYEAEQYRGLRHLVEQAHRTSALSVLAVSSATVGDGKTTTAINLAGALAQAADARVLLMDVDLRRPAIAERLGLEEGRHGLVDAILSHDLKLADVARPCGPLNLAVVTRDSATCWTRRAAITTTWCWTRRPSSRSRTRGSSANGWTVFSSSSAPTRRRAACSKSR